MTSILRRVRFAPYRKGHGPTFALTMWDSGRTDSRGQTVITYRLNMIADGKAVCLFHGSDFSCSPMYADDSDASVRSLMTFLTLRPGDTDADYFEAYTEAQLDYCREHAESLAWCVECRYGEEM